MPPHYGKFIAYFRVSTDRQGKSGLGLAAQREAVMSYLDGGRWALVDEFTEIESGKRNDRPELVKALAACKKQKAKLVIAKLDRLSRNLGVYRNADGFRCGVRRCRQSACQQADHPYPGGCGPTRAGNHQRTDIGCPEGSQSARQAPR